MVGVVADVVGPVLRLLVLLLLVVVVAAVACYCLLLLAVGFRDLLFVTVLWLRLPLSSRRWWSCRGVLLLLCSLFLVLTMISLSS